jgi:hypothetical protein
VIYSVLADINNGCKVNVHYEPPEHGLVRAETYVGVKSIKGEKIVHFVGV